MMKAIMNAVRFQIQRAMASLVQPRIGSVTSFDPNTMTAIVQLQPEGEMTGWLKISSAWIGNQWGLFAPVNIGDLVEVAFVNGDLNAGTIVGRFYNQQNQPLAVQAGEFWLVHKKGQSVKITNDGKMTLNDGHGATVTLDGSGNVVSQASQWTHTGPVEFKSAVHFDDNVQVDKTLTANTDVIGGGKSLKTHIHSGVLSGGADTGPPV